MMKISVDIYVCPGSLCLESRMVDICKMLSLTKDDIEWHISIRPPNATAVTHGSMCSNTRGGSLKDLDL